MTHLMIMDSTHGSCPTVLCVEDSEEDFALFRLASSTCRARFLLQHAAGGEEAIAYLSGADGYGDREAYSLPDLVLLDLNMPRLDGFEVLQWIRANSATRPLPVVVLAGSSFRADIRRAMELGANHYATKPATFAELQALIDQLTHAWLVRASVAG